MLFLYLTAEKRHDAVFPELWHALHTTECPLVLSVCDEPGLEALDWTSGVQEIESLQISKGMRAHRSKLRIQKLQPFVAYFFYLSFKVE